MSIACINLYILIPALVDVVGVVVVVVDVIGNVVVVGSSVVDGAAVVADEFVVDGPKIPINIHYMLFEIRRIFNSGKLVIYMIYYCRFFPTNENCRWDSETHSNNI